MAKRNNSEYLRLVDESLNGKMKSREKYLCKCILCGNNKEVRADHLHSNASKSCGCLKEHKPPSSDFTGKVINGALVYGYVSKSMWRCYHQECGHWTDIDADSLKRYDINRSLCSSCSRSKMLTERNTSHGRSSVSDSTYSTWMSMRRRCGSENSNNYHRYGKRGIKVCQEWDNSFQKFLEDMGERPEGTTIDRIDNDGDYCKENCRWVDMYEQAKSKTNNYLIRIDGEDNTLRAWCTYFGLEYKNIFYHFKYAGKPLEKLLGVESVEFVNIPTVMEKL